MPQLGMTMEEGVVVKWPISVEEPFAEGDVIAS
jgi:pyruvate/2-oxoglutarate dehydrogenase complex dihydrolipoamide acyltransferase (E2) component